MIAAVDNQIVSRRIDGDASGIIKLCGSGACHACPKDGDAARARGCRSAFLKTMIALVDNQIVSRRIDGDASGFLKLCWPRAVPACPKDGDAARARGCRKAFLNTMIVLVDNQVVSRRIDGDAIGVIQLCWPRAVPDCPRDGTAGRARGCRQAFLNTIIVRVDNQVVSRLIDGDAKGIIQLCGSRPCHACARDGDAVRARGCGRAFLHTVIVTVGNQVMLLASSAGCCTECYHNRNGAPHDDTVFLQTFCVKKRNSKLELQNSYG